MLGWSVTSMRRAPESSVGGVSYAGPMGGASYAWSFDGAPYAW